MESEDNFDETIAKKYLKTNILYRSSEKDAASKGVAYAKSIGRIIIPHFLIGVLIVLILFLNLCMREKKKMKRQYPKIDDSRNWFYYGSEKNQAKYLLRGVVQRRILYDIKSCSKSFRFFNSCYYRDIFVS